MLRQSHSNEFVLMNYSFPQLAPISGFMSLNRVRTSGPISGRTGDVRPSFGHVGGNGFNQSFQYNKDDAAVPIT
jgi:hypothetical protein